MDMTLSPNQVLAIWNLLFTGEEPKLAKWKPALTSEERRPLLEAGLVEMERRGRSIHVLLTEKGWAWAAAHLDASVAESPAAAHALAGVLRALKRHLDHHQTTLAQFLADLSEPSPQRSLALEEPEPLEEPGDVEGEAGPTAENPSSSALAPSILSVEPGDRPLEPDRPADAAVPSLSVTDLAGRIRSAYLNASGGSGNVRVRLSQLHQLLADIPKKDLDAQLVRMQTQGQYGLVLWSLDDPFDIRPEDEAAAVSVAGIRRHIVYMEA
jgi:DNA-binding MarR family transcriptional regulator